MVELTRIGQLRQEISSLLFDISDKIEVGDLSYDLSCKIHHANALLGEIQHTGCKGLLDRLALLVIDDVKTSPWRYEIIKKKIEAMDPLDPSEDCRILRSIAKKVRSEEINI